MAIHSELPIYKAAYDLLDVAIESTRQMRRDVKQILGRKLVDECVEITVHIQQANRARDKAPLLLVLQERTQAAEVLFRVCRDKRYLDLGKYARAVELTQSIGRQATGWSRSKSASAPVA